MPSLHTRRLALIYLFYERAYCRDVLGNNCATILIGIKAVEIGVLYFFVDRPKSELRLLGGGQV